jgi:hypothetical protein
MRWWIFGFHKMLGSSRVAAQLAASREGLGSMSDSITYPFFRSFYLVTFARLNSVLRATYFVDLVIRKDFTVAARSESWTVFARSNTGIVGSNATRGMDICVSLFCVCAVLCVGRGLATGWSPVQGALPTVYRLRNWKSGQGPQGAVEP